MTDNDLIWYEIIEDNQILQGDFLDKVPIPIPPIDIIEVPGSDVGFEFKGKFKVETFNIVVMSQSCDLDQLEDDHEVLLCHRYDFSSAYEAKTQKSRNDWGMYAKRKNTSPYLLNKCELEGFNFDYQLVDFHRIFSIPFGLIKMLPVFNAKRLRLLSPYREHLSQAFAKVFMRVGLPVDIPEKYPY